MTAYYNEIDLHAAQWLRNLIAAGHIAPGVVDTRSIEDVQPDDLREFTQCHFFAGVGVWSLALRRAGWSDDRPVWTGSCPCQPFSAAGKGAGFADERHLWPAFGHLIKECAPAIVLGEQVASKDVDAWIDLVHADLETMGYAFGSVPFPSAGVGAPHIRDRNYWVANAQGERRDGRQDTARQGGRSRAEAGSAVHQLHAELPPALGVGRRRTPGGLAYSDGGNTSAERQQRSGQQRQQPQNGGISGLEYASGAGLPEQSGRRDGPPRLAAADGTAGTGPTNGFWRDADWLGCTDGKWRPVEPGTFPLAHGATGRVGRLRAYGNAINAEAARVWIEAVMEAAC